MRPVIVPVLCLLLFSGCVAERLAGRYQIIRTDEGGEVFLLDTITRRLWECDQTQNSEASGKKMRVRDCLVLEESTPKVREAGWALLSVDSIPSGAEVFIDSEYRGTTPLRNEALPAENFQMTLSKEGYLRHSTRIQVTSGERKSLEPIKLDPFFGEIALSSFPPRATVFLDGERVDARTPLTIRRITRDKPHRIRLELAGYLNWEKTVSLEDKVRKKFDVQLEKTP